MYVIMRELRSEVKYNGPLEEYNNKELLSAIPVAVLSTVDDAHDWMFRNIEDAVKSCNSDKRKFNLTHDHNETHAVAVTDWKIGERLEITFVVRRVR